MLEIPEERIEKSLRIIRRIGQGRIYKDNLNHLIIEMTDANMILWL